jgi:hypothetical protein
LNNSIIKEDRLNYVLVEGRDDVEVVRHLLIYYNLEPYITVENKQGINNLLEGLEVELMRRAETRLAVIVDADTDISHCWLSLRQRLIEAGYTTVPPQPAPDGTIIGQTNRPTVGIWLMPDNTLSGMIEDFISMLIPENDMLWPIAQNVVQQVIVTDRRFPETQTAKANIHTWLAWQEEPGKPMGQAITKRYLKADALHAQKLIAWLRRLFDLESA